MFTSSSLTPDRKPSKSNFGPLRSQAKPGLAVDTSFSRHKGKPPQQVFPYESKTQELDLVGSITSKERGERPRVTLKQHLETLLPHRHVLQRSATDTPRKPPAINNAPAVRPLATRCQTSEDTLRRQPSAQVIPLHKRIKGLRPAPLDLTPDVSPYDRAITIGIDLSATSLTNLTNDTSLHRVLHAPQYKAPEVKTPTIVITPAKDHFDLDHDIREHYVTQGYRPASSVYSRYTHDFPRAAANSDAPPVPPLPSSSAYQASRASAVTVFEEELPAQSTRGGRDSASTAVEEQDQSVMDSYEVKRLTSQSHLPTPRRSKGWWNLVMSPFSAGPKSSASFWRSPSFPEVGEDRRHFLGDASDMGIQASPPRHLFKSAGCDDGEPRTAYPPDTGLERPSVPRRSDRAPGAIDANSNSINIYRTPSQGLAAAYYDPNKRFPSLLLDVNGIGVATRDLEGWSPSHSVAHPDSDRARLAFDQYLSPKSLHQADETVPERAGLELPGDTNADVGQSDELTMDRGEAAEFENPHLLESELFSSPSEDELKNPSPTRPATDRKGTQGTITSCFSPLSATPVVEYAQNATFMGPHSSNGELREVELTPSRTPSPPGPALGTATMAHREPGSHSTDRAVPWITKTAPFRPTTHARNDSSGSFGLGISGGQNEKSLYSTPKRLPQLATDRFGQLTVHDPEKLGTRAHVPWHQRFFWWSLFFGTICLVRLVVLLVVLVPQRHDDMPVEAQWLNLTGFPAVPLGVATVVRPSTAKDISGCVSPQSLWNCAVPEQASVKSSQLDQPDFRFEIRFRNGTVPSNETQDTKRSLGSTARAGTLVRRMAWGALFAANPPAPSEADQQFLGQYSDSNSIPYDGEQTPFYMSLLNASALTIRPSKLERRQGNPYPYPTAAGQNSSTGPSNASTTAANAIPRPLLQEDGSPSAPRLYPFAAAQPLRLYNRGQDDEHYGFYTYFDRSSFVSNLTTGRSSSSDSDNGAAYNVSLSNASAVCTWSQTRLHVQIWTRKLDVASLAGSSSSTAVPAGNSTANDLTSPGSFPYAVTVSLDRHGGNAKKKAVYCYGLDEQQKVMENVKMWVDEDRASGGTIVNPATVPGGNGSIPISVAQRHVFEYGGIDGGTGGCACQWQNWA